MAAHTKTPTVTKGRIQSNLPKSPTDKASQLQCVLSKTTLLKTMFNSQNEIKFHNFNRYTCESHYALQIIIHIALYDKFVYTVTQYFK